jgi:hypothetical protein
MEDDELEEEGLKMILEVKQDDEVSDPLFHLQENS